MFVVRRSPLARPLTAVVAAVLVTSALVGCTGVSFSGACEPVFEPGDASNAVTATGDVGDSPAVEFPTPLIAEETQRSVLVQGDGEPAAAGSVIRARYTYFDGATGASGTESTELFTASDLAMGLGESLECVTVGSRIAVVGPVAEVLDGVEEGTEGTIVAILDIEAIYLGKANGVNQLPQDGMPTVVTAVNGEPGISSTYQPIAEEPRTATIKAGSGATVTEDDTVVFHARSWNWSAGTTNTVTLGDVDSWTTGTPYAFAPTVDSLGDETLVDAFIGATVGSQILVVIPAADSASSATVFVFDILGILATE
ncbi:peptidylprolyl isomerase [Pseudolysinimonas yzui]|uniref:Peptidylprolyl isomerase n=1 Tax=Pseudolysinimonas yzui TaxID=2708254 RepID=A0A8J3GP18_9MICO|nr:peptidylprolyl isomerase [Pseudolysinimonas yzui]